MSPKHTDTTKVTCDSVNTFMISTAQKSISPKEFIFNAHGKSLPNEQFMKKKKINVFIILLCNHFNLLLKL